MKRTKVIAVSIVGIVIIFGVIHHISEKLDAQEQVRIRQHYQSTRQKLKTECDKLADDPAILAEVAVLRANLAELVALRRSYNEAKQGPDGGEDISAIVRDYASKALSASDRHTKLVEGEIEIRMSQVDLVSRELSDALDPITGPTAFNNIKNPTSDQLDKMFKQWGETFAADVEWAQEKLVRQIIEPLDEVAEELRPIFIIAIPAIKEREVKGERITDEVRLEEFTKAAFDWLAKQFEDEQSGS